LDWKDLNATDPEFVKSVEKCEAVRRDDIRYFTGGLGWKRWGNISPKTLEKTGRILLPRHKKRVVSASQLLTSFNFDF